MGRAKPLIPKAGLSNEGIIPIKPEDKGEPGTLKPAIPPTDPNTGGSIDPPKDQDTVVD